MCGIVGFTHRTCVLSPGTIRSAVQSLIHRGPDQQGIYETADISLGAVRLKIIDLVEGDQPMISEDGDTVLVFNGEIWNFKTLRQELLEKAHCFRTNSDTEVIVHAYEEYGLDCIQRLHGMFGLAIWDQPRKRLLLARGGRGRGDRMVDVLEAGLWPRLPAGVRSVPVTRAQREAILGYGPEGV